MYDIGVIFKFLFITQENQELFRFSNIYTLFILYNKRYNMPFKKGTSGNPIGRPKGSLSTTTKLIREHISQAIDGNKIMEMLDKIESPTEYINAISKLLPYSIGKVKPYEEIEEREPIDIKIDFFTTTEEEE